MQRLKLLRLYILTTEAELENFEASNGENSS